MGEIQVLNQLFGLAPQNLINSQPFVAQRITGISV